MRASYLQIYNEVISDLLKPERSNLVIREGTRRSRGRCGSWRVCVCGGGGAEARGPRAADPKKGVFVEGLSEWVVRSPQVCARGAAPRAAHTRRRLCLAHCAGNIRPHGARRADACDGEYEDERALLAVARGVHHHCRAVRSAGCGGGLRGFRRGCALTGFAPAQTTYLDEAGNEMSVDEFHKLVKSRAHGDSGLKQLEANIRQSFKARAQQWRMACCVTATAARAGGQVEPGGSGGV